MAFGHIVLEGYCLHDDELIDVPCKGKNIVSTECFSEDHTICQFFGWCSAKNLVIMTDDSGNERKCMSYTEENKEKVENLLFQIDEAMPETTPSSTPTTPTQML